MLICIIGPYNTRCSSGDARKLARGNSIKQIAGMLIISEKTVDNHIQHIYNKIGVSTHANATLFAMKQNLLTPAE
ncbi:MAG TPA: LuxR C-terminal-related transcriptional regulator [Ktedonobacteraceae bacterium]|nr:LuxR C-terminal-related transcriptional regulator [Ktedonobacteraceae bacterium]